MANLLLLLLLVAVAAAGTCPDGTTEVAVAGPAPGMRLHSVCVRGAQLVAANAAASHGASINGGSAAWGSLVLGLQLDQVRAVRDLSVAP